MSGRHRRQRARTGIGRRVLTGVVPVLAAAGVAAAVVLSGGVLGGGVLDGGVLDGGFGSRDVAALGAPAAAASPASAAAAAPSILRTLPGAGAAADTVGEAVTAASARAERDRRAAEQEATAEDDTRSAPDGGSTTDGTDTGSGGAATGSGECDLEGPPRFDDPAHPNWITNRDCGYVDDQGRERSYDPWIDGQLSSAYGE